MPTGADNVEPPKTSLAAEDSEEVDYENPGVVIADIIEEMKKRRRFVEGKHKDLTN